MSEIFETKYLKKIAGINLKIVIDENEAPSQGNSNNNNNESHATNNSYELFIEELCYQVINLSYTIQPDMITILMRKRVEKTWKNLQKPKDNHPTQTFAQVYL